MSTSRTRTRDVPPSINKAYGLVRWAAETQCSVLTAGKNPSRCLATL